MRRFSLECQACESPRFRTSPISTDGGDRALPGLDAASVQLAEHTYEAHGNDERVSFVSVEMPDEAAGGEA